MRECSFDDYEDYFDGENADVYAFYIHCLNIKQFEFYSEKGEKNSTGKAVF
jgi:hypothetical protein